jgi:hypothetical protein
VQTSTSKRVQKLGCNNILGMSEQIKGHFKEFQLSISVAAELHLQ